MKPKKPAAADFPRLLNEVLSPSNPIRREDHLKGRQRQLKQMERAMATVGRSAFVWGPRGVGKTSVAQTSAFLHQPAGSKPVLLTCDKNTTAGRLVLNLAEELLGTSSLDPGWELSGGLKLGPLGVQGKRNHPKEIEAPTTLHDAIRLLRAALGKWSGGNENKVPVVVIDEFDLLGASEDRRFFGDLVKQIGDQMLPVRVIFAGVSHSLQDLLEGHQSAHRYLEPVELERLALGACEEILKTAGEALGATFHEDHLLRIAMISDGFPYYVHLIGSSILWEWFEDPVSGSDVKQKYYEAGLLKAADSCDGNLRHLYEKATRKYTGGYDHVLWAVVSNNQLQRRSADIFDDYVHNEHRLAPSNTPDRQTFNTKINRLKTETHGSVLLGSRQGWYEFRLPILRGYCRLVAKQAGLDLGDDYPVSRPFKMKIDG